MTKKRDPRTWGGVAASAALQEIIETLHTVAELVEVVDRLYFAEVPDVFQFVRPYVAGEFEGEQHRAISPTAVVLVSYCRLHDAVTRRLLFLPDAEHKANMRLPVYDGGLPLYLHDEGDDHHECSYRDDCGGSGERGDA